MSSLTARTNRTDLQKLSVPAAAHGSFASFAAPVIAKQQTIAAVPGQMQNFKPVFDKHLSKLNSTSTELGQQYGIWQVAGLGVVVAFQGCRTPLDKLAQLSCKPCSLDNHSQIQLHEGICQADAPCCKELAQACVKLCSASPAAEQKSLFITGVSTPFSQVTIHGASGILFNAAAYVTVQDTLLREAQQCVRL